MGVQRNVKVCFIINPRSGRRSNNPSMVDRAKLFLGTHQLEGRVILTERPFHASELARTAVADGFDLVVAVGGDGTINEVGCALIGTRATLGIIPRGSGNGLGRHLGIRHGAEHAFDTLRVGRTLEVDTGVVNGLPFINVMGVGFDAELSRRFSTLASRGLRAYVRTAAGLFLSYRSDTYTVRMQESELTATAFLVAVANSDQYGNDCYVAPGASMSDGLLDLTLIKEFSWLRLPSLATRLFTRTVDGSPLVSRLRASSFVIERSGDGPIHTDGEVHVTGRQLKIAVHRASLRVKVPE